MQLESLLYHSIFLYVALVFLDVSKRAVGLNRWVFFNFYECCSSSLSDRLAAIFRPAVFYVLVLLTHHEDLLDFILVICYLF